MNIRSEFLRFVLVAIFRTGLGILVYSGLVYFMPYVVAIALSYVVGIASSYTLNSIIVFRQSMTVGKAGRFPLVYVFQYLVVTLITILGVEVFTLGERVAYVMGIIIVAPITFIASRYIIVGKRDAKHLV